MPNIWRKRGVSVAGMLAPLLLFSSLFPYVQIVPSGSYTQPQAFFFGGLLFILSFGLLFKLPLADSFALIGLAFIGWVMFIFSCYPYNDFQGYVYLLAYISPLLMIPAFVRVGVRFHKFTVRFLQISIVIWILVATAQYLFDPTLATFLLGRWGESALDIVFSGRGVLGLAPEPTHHAFHMLLLGASLALMDERRLSRILCFGCVTSALLLASSSSALLVLSMSAIAWLLRSSLMLGTFLIVGGGVGWTLLPVLMESLPESDSRVISLISAFVENPLAFVNADYSVNVRLGGLWATIQHVTEGLFVPHGLSYDGWLDARSQMLRNNAWLFDLSMVGPPSGIGMLLFQAGVLVFPFLMVLVWRCLSVKPSNNLGQILVLSVPFIFLNQFYISSPLFSIVYACIVIKQIHGESRQKPILLKRTDVNIVRTT